MERLPSPVTAPAPAGPTAMPISRLCGRRGHAHRMGRAAAAWPLIALLSFGALDCAAQSAPSAGGAWTVTLENDALTGSDNNYTSGVGVTWVSRAIDTSTSAALSAGGANHGRCCLSSARRGTAPTSPGRWRRRCTRRTTSRSPIRRWTTSPTPAFCTSTTRSMQGVSVRHTHGSSESAWWDRRPAPGRCRSGFTT